MDAMRAKMLEKLIDMLTTMPDSDEKPEGSEVTLELGGHDADDKGSLDDDQDIKSALPFMKG